MNDLDLCLEVVSRSRQLLRYIWRWISRKPLEIEAWFQRTTNRKWHMGYRMVTWPMTSRDLESSNSWPPIRLERNVSKCLSYRLQIWYAALGGECRAGAQIIFPQSGRGLSHVTPIFWHTIERIFKTTLATQQTSNLIHGFVWGMLSGRINNFP